MRKVIELNNTEARAFFLKEESYFNFDLPHYFEFQPLIDKISKKLSGKVIEEFYLNYNSNSRKAKPPFPSYFEDVNYTLLNNKDGKYAWRPFQLIHPVLYVSLVNMITEEANWDIIIGRFNLFRNNTQIECFSIPLESDSDLSDRATTVSNWWQYIEQYSIQLALKYEYVLHTDVTDCYGSIYTHSVPWALHTKTLSKTKKDDSLLGNNIDSHLRNMSYGQTNGIPQGSVLMDFIAEIVLGYADLKLTDKINEKGITDYQIIRYRDDYRIFSNNPQIAEQIAKLLTETLINLGLRLNNQKTFVSNNVVRDSIKPDKIYWITAIKGAKNLQGHLLIIHDLSQKFPNSGSLSKALTKFYNRIKDIQETTENVVVMISILVDISYKNPRTYPIVSAILSKLFTFIDNVGTRDRILNDISSKFSKIPNTGLLKLWLQRITIKLDRQRNYEEKLCQKVNDNTIQIWNSNWLNSEMKAIMESELIVNEQIIESIDIVIDSSEVQLFELKSTYESQTEDETE